PHPLELRYSRLESTGPAWFEGVGGNRAALAAPIGLAPKKCRVLLFPAPASNLAANGWPPHRPRSGNTTATPRSRSGNDVEPVRGEYANAEADRAGASAASAPADVIAQQHLS